MIFTARNFSLVIFIYIKSSTSGDRLVIAIDSDILFDEHCSLSITQACRRIQRKVTNQSDRTASRCSVDSILQGSVANTIYASDSFSFIDYNCTSFFIPFISSWNILIYIARESTAKDEFLIIRCHYCCINSATLSRTCKFTAINRNIYILSNLTSTFHLVAVKVAYGIVVRTVKNTTINHNIQCGSIIALSSMSNNCDSITNTCTSTVFSILRCHLRRRIQRIL